MTAAGSRSVAQNVGLVLGMAAFLATVFTDPPAGFTPASWHVAGTMALMALWWATEALPFAATALVPLAVLPALGAASAGSLASGYGNTTLYLILGGFLLALAMERCNLHRRIAYTIVSWAGGHPQGLVLGMMCATGFVSMWAQNTSTTLMMLPVAMSVAAIVLPDADAGDRDARNFSRAIVLCVAYAATIGGLGTVVGTATNALVVGFMQQNYGETISFARWLLFGIPTVVLLMPLAWLVLVRLTFPFQLGSQATARDRILEARRALGPMSAAERRVRTVFLLTAGAWITGPLLRRLPGLADFNDTTIALLAGLSLFLIPSGAREGGALIAGADLRRLPWEVLLLFGGGLALAEAIQGSGLSDTMGAGLAQIGTWPLVALVLAMVTLLVMWTELNSNVATAATFMPILAAIAAASDYPVLQLVAPAAIAASCGFMLPVGTPPNAIVFASGRLVMQDMIRAGWRINIAAIVVVTAVSTIVLPRIV
ncbi:MAG TPA: DASS family sodium-coupled anion symporter [Steroidobacteraceae bacterium]|nr:DASS family sodium-coupled anion symporter [Steroidobacteraceae bacterium]